MPSQRTGARATGSRVAATPQMDRSRVGREGSTDSVGGGPATRRQSVQPSSASKRPTSASSTRRSSSVGPVGTSAKDRVTCIVRKRPAKDGEVDVVNVEGTAIVKVAEPKQKVDLTRYTENHQFTFDHAFSEVSRNEEVYNCSTKPLVHFVVEGGMGTCFAFGQTGSGKTFTMLGAPEAGQRGLYLLAADDMFRLTENHSDGIGIFVSMMEIYGDEVFDLLSREKKKLVPREDAKKKVQIAGLTEFAVHSSEELMMAIEDGSQLRSTSTTGMNEQSSRSHAILQMTLRNPRGKLHGQMSFIDLAGSEKGSDTAENEKKTRMEGAEINKSLLALKECIRSMTDANSSYTPFRSSKLTQVLKESFVGNGRTVMIANISPAASSSMETVNTLRYADRVKAIGKSASGRDKTNLVGASSYTSTTSAVSAPRATTAPSYFEARQAQASAAAPRNRAVKSKNAGLDMSIEKENLVNRVDGGRHRRASQGGAGGNALGRYDSSMVEASFDDDGDDSEMPHKRRRSLTRANNSVSKSLSLDASECSFEDLDLEDTEDQAYVYHGDAVHPSRPTDARAVSGASSKQARVEQQQQQQQGGQALEPSGDPVEFVNLFRSQIEKSMALIEQEVVMLDRLERGGDEPLTADNVDQVQRLLEERMTIASTLRNELRRYTRV